jgi:hypothetical protein
MLANHPEIKVIFTTGNHFVKGVKIPGCSQRQLPQDSAAKVVAYIEQVMSGRGAGEPAVLATDHYNPEMFMTFRIEDGNLMWGDFDLVFPIVDLYEKNIDARAR